MKDKTQSPSFVQQYTQKVVSSWSFSKSTLHKIEFSQYISLCFLGLDLHAELLWRDRKNNKEVSYFSDFNLEKMNPHFTAASGEFKNIFLHRMRIMDSVPRRW